MEGHVKWYSEKKGYGFIETAEDGDIFVHKSGIEDHGHFGLQKLDRVTFETKKCQRDFKRSKLKLYQHKPAALICFY